MDQSTPGPLVFHCLPELGQIHVGRFDDPVQPSRPLSSPSPLAFTLSQHQGLFQGDFSSHEMVKILEPQLQDLSFHVCYNRIQGRRFQQWPCCCHITWLQGGLHHCPYHATNAAQQLLPTEKGRGPTWAPLTSPRILSTSSGCQNLGPILYQSDFPATGWRQLCLQSVTHLFHSGAPLCGETILDHIGYPDVSNSI